MEGHDKPCPFCGEKTNTVAANPGLWPVALHSDQPGVVGWWHAGCAIDRIERAKRFEAELHKWLTDYERSPDGSTVAVPVHQIYDLAKRK